jgi:hypothetical protein
VFQVCYFIVLFLHRPDHVLYYFNFDFTQRFFILQIVQSAFPKLFIGIVILLLSEPVFEEKRSELHCNISRFALILNTWPLYTVVVETGQKYPGCARGRESARKTGGGGSVSVVASAP